MKRVIVVFLVASVLSACNPRYRAYDGVLGFQSSSENGDTGAIRVSYTDQAKVKWERIEQHLLRGCSEALGEEPQRVHLSDTRQDTGTVTAKLAVPMTSVIQSQSISNGVWGTSNATYSTDTFNQTIHQEMQVRTLHAVCTLSHAAP